MLKIIFRPYRQQVLYIRKTSPQSLSIVTDYFNSVQISPQNPYKLSKNVKINVSDSEKDFSEDDEGDDVADDEELYNFFNDPLSPPSVRLTPFDNQVGETLRPDLYLCISIFWGFLMFTHRGELGSMPEVVFEQNKHLLPEWMLNKALCTKVNKQLKEEVLGEVFSPKALRSYITRRHSMINISNSEKPKPSKRRIIKTSNEELEKNTEMLTPSSSEKINNPWSLHDLWHAGL
ncbi:unnamed protein product [Rhizophagus irregularis]|nr:unnamed protein product [Rhizophagus irregularis]